MKFFCIFVCLLQSKAAEKQAAQALVTVEFPCRGKNASYLLILNLEHKLAQTETECRR